jgi:hypothetical protein
MKNTNLNHRSIYVELLETLYSNVNPYDYSEKKYIDNGYNHTNIIPELLNVLFANIEPTYITECGSYHGGSIIEMQKALHKLGQNKDCICVDPFTGDANMWCWEAVEALSIAAASSVPPQEAKALSKYFLYLNLENGTPTIYKRFLANIKEAGYDNLILPINCTTTVGIEIIRRLYDEDRISALPNYIYLDSAHEEHETFLELKCCWDLLGENSVLFGDDWEGPDAFDQSKTSLFVGRDVEKFSDTVDVNSSNLMKIHKLLPESTIYNNKILLLKGESCSQWALFK